MSPSHARKGNTKIETTCPRPRPTEQRTVPDRCAACRESTLRRWLSSRFGDIEAAEPIDDRNLIETYVTIVEVSLISWSSNSPGLKVRSQSVSRKLLTHSLEQRTAKRRREILLPKGAQRENARPIRSETRATLVVSIAQGRRWLNELTTDVTATAESIAMREGCSPRRLTSRSRSPSWLLISSRQQLTVDFRAAWALPASPTCPLNGPSNIRCWAFLAH